MSAKDNAVKLANFLLDLADRENPDCTAYDTCTTRFEYAAQEHGFNLLGCGYFADVFSHPSAPGYAIKVCVRDGDSSPAYMAWARANPGPHVPRIHHLKRHGQYVVAVLDQLQEMNYDARCEYEEYLDRYLSKTNDHPANLVAQRIRRFFDGACTFDLHPANCMMDKNNQLVLTDPVSFSDSEKSRALRTGIERAFDIAA
ncbi:Phage protein kinase [Xylella phage Cota]|uniref:Phage protein kinase n=1 Tax=Xylella phage Cota TaxID=2699877 RepID=A0A6F8ZJY8_9CAUD|nr:Phage protein kinase [Xylella phage Cota]